MFSASLKLACAADDLTSEKANRDYILFSTKAMKLERDVRKARKDVVFSFSYDDDDDDDDDDEYCSHFLINCFVLIIYF